MNQPTDPVEVTFMIGRYDPEDDWVVPNPEVIKISTQDGDAILALIHVAGWELRGAQVGGRGRDGGQLQFWITRPGDYSLKPRSVPTHVMQGDLATWQRFLAESVYTAELDPAARTV